jgi:hypothetical protein
MGGTNVSNLGRHSDMKLFWPTFASCAAAALMTGAATAAVSQQLAGASTGRSATARTAAATTEPQQPQNPLQALCRVIFVDVDEGYGVTGQETRTICDEPR